MKMNILGRIRAAFMTKNKAKQFDQLVQAASELEQVYREVNKQK